MSVRTVGGDGGDDVHRRFRYQAGIAALLTLDLVVDSQLHAIWCEQADDILVEKTGKFRVIQVKSRIASRDPLRPTSTEVLHALKRFVGHEAESGGEVEAYVLATNAGIWRTTDKSGLDLYRLRDFLAGSHPVGAPWLRKAQELVARLGESGSESRLVAMAGKLEFLSDLPHFDDIDAAIQHKLIGLYPNSRASDVASVARSLLDLACRAGSKPAGSDRVARLRRSARAAGGLDATPSPEPHRASNRIDEVQVRSALEAVTRGAHAAEGARLPPPRVRVAETNEIALPPYEIDPRWAFRQQHGLIDSPSPFESLDRGTIVVGDVRHERCDVEYLSGGAAVIEVPEGSQIVSVADAARILVEPGPPLARYPRGVPRLRPSLLAAARTPEHEMLVADAVVQDISFRLTSPGRYLLALRAGEEPPSGETPHQVLHWELAGSSADRTVKFAIGNNHAASVSFGLRQLLTPHGCRAATMRISQALDRGVSVRDLSLAFRILSIWKPHALLPWTYLRTFRAEGLSLEDPTFELVLENHTDTTGLITHVYAGTRLRHVKPLGLFQQGPLPVTCDIEIPIKSGTRLPIVFRLESPLALPAGLTRLGLRLSETGATWRGEVDIGLLVNASEWLHLPTLSLLV